MIRFNSLFVLFLIFGSFSVLAQNTAPIWTGIYQGSGDNSDKFNKIVSDGFGNFIGTGYTVKNGNHRDILTVKFDANGDTLWWRTKNGKGNADDEGISLDVDASGNVYVAAYADEGITQNDIMVIKIDASGMVQWDTTWNSPSSLDDLPVSVKIDNSGNCLVAGNAEPDTVTGSSDYITLKFAPNGSLLWATQFTRSGVANGKDELTALTLDTNGNAFVTGRSFNGTNDDFVTIKYDGTNGMQSWLLAYNGGAEDRATAIVTDHLDDVIITGRSNNGSDFDFRTIKYSNSGLLQWTRLYNAPASEDDRPAAITVDDLNNVIVAGIADVDGTASTNYDFQVVKYDVNGTLQWAVRTGNVVMQDDEAFDVVADASGNIFVCGRTDMNPTPGVSDYDFMTVMYNANGNLQWSNSPLYLAGTRPMADDASYSLLLDEGGNLYVAGGTVNNVTQKDATVVKYDISSGTEVWLRSYNGSGDFSASARAIVTDANNISYAAGYSYQENQNLNACITKFDQGGQLLCSYQYNGLKNDDDEFETIVITANGSIYAAGYTKVTGQKSNMLLVKWDAASCDTVWTRTYDFIGQGDKAISIVPDVLGNIYLTGRSDSDPGDTLDNFDIVTIKYDPNGNALWTQRFNGSGNMLDEPSKIILDNNGDVLVAGRTENVHDDDFIVIKYNAANGNPIWGSPIIYNGPFSNDERLSDILVDASNNIFVGGYSQTSSGVTTNDPVILKYDNAGNQLGFFSYFGDGKDDVVKLGVDINNNVYALFKFDTQPGIVNNSYNFLLKKFDNNLTDLWLASSPQYNDPFDKDDEPSDLKISPNGDIYVTGSTENDTVGGRVNKNWVTIGYNDQGNQLFISNFDGANATDDSPNAITIRGTSMWVCGNTEGTNNNQKDLTVNNYNLPVGIKNYSDNNPAIVYPNPFSSSCLITISGLYPSSESTLEVFDLLGNQVRLSKGLIGNTFRFNKEDLSAGIYQFQITNENKSISRGKFIIH